MRTSCTPCFQHTPHTLHTRHPLHLDRRPSLNVPLPDQMEELLDYMSYMEGLAEGLTRVLYVHGSGQEIINLDHME